MGICEGQQNLNDEDPVETSLQINLDSVIHEYQEEQKSMKERLKRAFRRKLRDHSKTVEMKDEKKLDSDQTSSISQGVSD